MLILLIQTKVRSFFQSLVLLKLQSEQRLLCYKFLLEQ